MSGEGLELSGFAEKTSKRLGKRSGEGFRLTLGQGAFEPGVPLNFFGGEVEAAASCLGDEK